MSEIVPIFNLRVALMRPTERWKYMRKSIEEAKESEDEDFVDIPKESETLEEECPISKDLKDFSLWLDGQKVDRDIQYIFLHCTATDPNAKVSSILNYWKNNLKWNNPGYNIILPKEGYTVLADFDQICNGVRGYNSKSIHISYIGGINDKGKPKDTRTPSQKRLIIDMTTLLKNKFPNAKIMLHNEVSSKACPSFDRAVLESELSK